MSQMNNILTVGVSTFFGIVFLEPVPNDGKARLSALSSHRP